MNTHKTIFYFLMVFTICLNISISAEITHVFFCGGLLFGDMLFESIN